MLEKTLYFLAVLFPLFAWIIFSLSTKHFLWILLIELPLFLFLLPNHATYDKQTKQEKEEETGV